MKQSLLSYSLLQKRPDRVREHDPRHFVCTLLRERDLPHLKIQTQNGEKRNIAFYLQQRHATTTNHGQQHRESIQTECAVCLLVCVCSCVIAFIVLCSVSEYQVIWQQRTNNKLLYVFIRSILLMQNISLCSLCCMQDTETLRKRPPWETFTLIDRE